MKTLSAIIIIVFFSAAAFAQAGELDSTFGGDGKVTTDIDVIGSDVGYSVAIQSDEKIVVAGYSENYAHRRDFALVRYNIDGTLDNSFGTGGKVTTVINVINYDDEARSVAIQTDGKIVAAGYSYNGFDDDFALFRYNPDGSLDNSFGTGGKLTTAFGSYHDGANSMAIQPDGKVIAAGYAYNSSGYDFALVRYNIDGTLDSSFGTSGEVATVVGTSGGKAFSTALQPDGKIVVAGIAWVGGTDNNFSLVRYNTDGTPDSNFGTDGKVITAITSGNDGASAVAIQTDGKIVAAGFLYIGYAYYNEDLDFALVRYKTDGTLDSSFGTDGIVRTAVDSSVDEAFSLVIQPDGKIVAAGYSNGLHDDFALVRYNINGTLDSSFNVTGILTTDFDSCVDGAYSVAMQTDGRIVAVGYSTAGTNGGFALARYLSGLNVGMVNFSSPQNSPLIYPNPIHQTETLEYTLTKNESLTIALYDVNGKLIRNFISNEQRAVGAHKETLNIGELHSGNYFLTISNGEQKMSVKMVKQ